MCVIVKYDGNALVKKEVLDLLLYAAAGRYSVDGGGGKKEKVQIKERGLV